jgi:hypothetical protein
MALLASEIRLLKAARKVFETGESIISRGWGYNKPTEPHNISLNLALEEAEKYFHGSHAAFSLAKGRLERRLLETGKYYVSGRDFIYEAGYRFWYEVYDDGGASRNSPGPSYPNEKFEQTINYFSDNGRRGRIILGDVSEETFNNWCVLATMAYIDRILETGEIK